MGYAGHGKNISIVVKGVDDFFSLRYHFYNILIINKMKSAKSGVLKLFFGLGCREETIDEISERFGITRERVRQIKEKGMRRLRQESRNNLLKAYLG